MDDESPPPWCWDLLVAAERNLRQLCRLLEKLPPERLRQYQAAFEEAKRSVDPYGNWRESGPHIAEWPSEDGADDFSAWVVMQGREFYHQVRSQPEDVQRYLDLFFEVEMGRRPELVWDEGVDCDDYRGYQRADSIAIPIYRARFGGEIDT